MKKPAIIFALFALFVFVGCASDSVLSTTSTSISLENVRSDVNLGETVFFEEGAVIDVDVTASRGSVDITITNEAGLIIYNMPQLGDASHRFQIGAGGYHTIRIVGDSHTGQVRLSW